MQTFNMADTSAQTVPGLPGWILYIKDGNGKLSIIECISKRVKVLVNFILPRKLIDL